MAALLDRLQERLPRPVARILRLLRTEDLFLLAAALAFYALVSAAPFTILVLWLISIVTGEGQVQEVAKRLADLLPSRLGVEQAFERVAELGASLGVGALLALLWPATAYGSGLRRAFDRLAPRSAGDDEARGLHGRALALPLLAIAPALVLGGLFASYMATKILGGGTIERVGGWVLAIVFAFTASGATVALIYRLFSPHQIPWSAVARGAGAAGAAISFLSLGYVVFLNVGTDFADRYATSGLAAVVLLAVWLYLVNALILVGYEIARDADAPMAPHR